MAALYAGAAVINDVEVVSRWEKRSSYSRHMTNVRKVQNVTAVEMNVGTMAPAQSFSERYTHTVYGSSDDAAAPTWSLV